MTFSSDTQGATPEQLRHDIDTGRTGDKVGGFDPAAAPLGADAEAGGHPTSPQTLARDRRQERSGAPRSGHANAAEPDLQPNARLPRQNYTVPILAGVGIAAVLAGAIAILL